MSYLVFTKFQTDSSGAIRGYGKANMENLVSKVQIPLIEDLYPCFMCNLCNNILSINIFVSTNQQSLPQQQFYGAQEVPSTPIFINNFPIDSFQPQNISVPIEPVFNFAPANVILPQTENNILMMDNQEPIHYENDEGGGGEESIIEDEIQSDDDDETEDETSSEEEEIHEEEHQEISNNDDSQDIESQTSQNDVSRDYSCLTCGKRFFSKSPLYNHYRVSSCPKPETRRRYKPLSTEIHSPEEVDVTTKTEVYPCEHCQRTFKTRYARYYHFKKSECTIPFERQRAPFHCELCNKILGTKRGYRLHLENHAKPPKEKAPVQTEFKCPDCNKVCKSKVGFNQHRFLHVTDQQRPFQCKICHRGFGSKLSLQMHELSHKNDENYICSICEEQFRDKVQLRIHILSHTAEFGENMENCDCPDGKLLKTNLEGLENHNESSEYETDDDDEESENEN
uniref:CSON015559 protein n=1 Tax=Culicoides sonorensis TaxID=179676 RepID=A0A336MD97_CULSO